jgi:hypothetical protein
VPQINPVTDHIYGAFFIGHRIWNSQVRFDSLGKHRWMPTDETPIDNGSSHGERSHSNHEAGFQAEILENRSNEICYSQNRNRESGGAETNDHAENHHRGSG